MTSSDEAWIAYVKAEETVVVELARLSYTHAISVNQFLERATPSALQAVALITEGAPAIAVRLGLFFNANRRNIRRGWQVARGEKTVSNVATWRAVRIRQGKVRLPTRDEDPFVNALHDLFVAYDPEGRGLTVEEFVQYDEAITALGGPLDFDTSSERVTLFLRGITNRVVSGRALRMEGDRLFVRAV